MYNVRAGAISLLSVLLCQTFGALWENVVEEGRPEKFTHTHTFILFFHGEHF